VVILLGAYLVSLCLSVVFSIDPLYSLYYLKGDVLKALVLFPIFATCFSTDDKLKRLSLSFCFSALIMTIIGFYSYMTQDIPVLKPNIELMYAWHNRYAMYVGLSIPFAVALLLANKNIIQKIFLGAITIFGLLGVILSTSRGGLFALVLIAFIWILFLFKKGLPHFRKAALIGLLSLSVLFTTGLFISPSLKARITSIPQDLKTFNNRLESWNKALEASKYSPIIGWGYGEAIFHENKPFQQLTDKALASRDMMGPENTFIKVIFHQGIVGIITYVSLIMTATIVFFRSALKTKNPLRSYMLITVCGIILGNYVGHALVFGGIYFRGLAIMLAIGLAAERDISVEKNSSLIA
jgi:O-antigen ligase